MSERVCARCGALCEWIECSDCDDGYSDHDCGEDVCCCVYPEDNVECEFCNGEGGWWQCGSSRDWCNANPLPGHEGVKRGQIKWLESAEDDA